MKKSQNGNLGRMVAQKISSPRWEKKRAAIIKTAGLLIVQNGYMETSLESIAKALNMNKATLYYYFEDKASILYAIASNNMNQLLDICREICDSYLAPEEKFEKMVKNHLIWTLSHPARHGALHYKKNLPKKLLRYYINMRDEYETMFRLVLKEGVTKGKFRSMNISLASQFILGFLNSITSWFKYSGRLSSDEIANEAYQFISSAISLRECCGQG